MARSCFPKAWLWITILLVGLPGISLGQDLPADPELPESVYYGPDLESRTYSRLHRDQRATYVFCGQGKLQVLSRAMLTVGTGAARYGLELSLDGAPAVELAHRAMEKQGAKFAGGYRAATLKRDAFDLGRGCHTVTLALARSTSEAVAVRVIWKDRPATKRPWADLQPERPRPVSVIVSDRSTAYELLDPAQSAELMVQGPAWIRLLTRSTGFDEATGYGVVVERGDRVYRQYRIVGSPSRRARIDEYPRLRLGTAKEVVFAVGPGRHVLGIRSAGDRGLAFRAQRADRRAVSMPGEPVSGWNTRVRVASYYDSNILRYSDKFIQRFDQGRDSGRFRVESLDDTIQRVDLDMTREYAGTGNKPATLALGISHRSYWRNSIKDWTRAQLTWEQHLRRGRRISLFVNGATDFYVRHLRDSDLVGAGSPEDRFQAFEFQRTAAGLRFTQELGTSSSLRYDLGIARFRHSDAFREFDSDNLSAGLRLDQWTSRRVRLSFGLEFTDSEAQGYDQAGETLETSDDTDPAYRQLDLMLAARIRLPGSRRQVLFLQAETGRREYTTDKPTNLAPLHSGREDDFLRLYGSWQLDLTPRYRLTIFGQSRERSSSAPIDLDIGVEKDYEQSEVGVRVGVRFDL